MNTTEHIIDALLDRFGGYADDDKGQYVIVNDGNCKDVDTIEMYWSHGALTIFALNEEITKSSTVVRTKNDAIRFVDRHLKDCDYY